MIATGLLDSGSLGWVLSVLFLATGGFFIIRGQKRSSADNASITTVTMMSGQIAALTSAQELSTARIGHLEQQLVDKDKMLDRNASDIERLQEALTQRAEVEAFRVECMDWLTAIGQKLVITPPAART